MGGSPIVVYDLLKVHERQCLYLRCVPQEPPAKLPHPAQWGNSGRKHPSEENGSISNTPNPIIWLVVMGLSVGEEGVWSLAWLSTFIENESYFF